jgi:hypothetical protein
LNSIQAVGDVYESNLRTVAFTLHNIEEPRCLNAIEIPFTKTASRAALPTAKVSLRAGMKSTLQS